MTDLTPEGIKLEGGATGTAGATDKALATPLASTIIHDLVLTGLTAASIFVKNPQSQAQAGALIGLVNAILKEHGASL
jgi:hypothetical protein